MGARQNSQAVDVARSIGAPQLEQRMTLTSDFSRSSSSFGIGRMKFFSCRNWKNGVRRPWPRTQR